MTSHSKAVELAREWLAWSKWDATNASGPMPLVSCISRSEALDTIAASVLALAAENERMRAGLERIAKHPHSMYSTTSTSELSRQYDMGVADGHRCAGGDAANCLAEVDYEAAQHQPATGEG